MPASRADRRQLVDLIAHANACVSDLIGGRVFVQLATGAHTMTTLSVLTFPPPQPDGHLS
jgi:hypothetical protein